MNLNATFKLFDGYSSTADKVIRKTDQATNKILNASGATDKFNRKLDATGASAGKASSGLGKVISAAALYMASMKGMNIADNYTNTAARLALINDGSQTQLELQNKIFAAADRSRGAYSDMAASVAKLGMLARGAFSSNDEAIAFVELMQKAFTLGGASQSEQSSGMYQLTQAMASGRLQGDEFVAIRENAPMLSQAIEDYMKNIMKVKGTMKDWSAQGLITSQVIKNALFMAGGDIEVMFAKLPITFAGIWNKIKNGAMKAFGPTIEKFSKIINSDKFKKFSDDLVVGLNVIGGVASKALDAMVNIYNFARDNWPVISELILAAAAAWGVYKAVMLGVSAVQWISSIANPIGIAIILIAVLAGAYVMLWEKSEWFRKTCINSWEAIAMGIAVAYNQIAITFNLFRIGWNTLIDSTHSFTKALKAGMIAAVLITSTSVMGMIGSFSGLIEIIGKMVDAYNLVAGISGKKTIDFDISTNGIAKALGSTAGTAIKGINGAFNGADSMFDKAKINKTMKFIDIEKLKSIADTLGNTMEDFTVSGWLKGLFSEASNALNSLLPGDSSDPTTVVGTGVGGSIPVDMSDEDLQYLRDIAEREYINKFSTATLAPSVTFTFGDVHEEADVNKLKGTLEMMMREEIATAAEGVY